MILVSSMLGQVFLLLHVLLVGLLLLLVLDYLLMDSLQLQLRLVHRVLLHCLQALDAGGFFSHASLHLHEMLGDTARVIWGRDGGAEGVIGSPTCCGGEEGGSAYLLLVGVMGLSVAIVNGP